MQRFIALLLHYGYALLFAVVLGQQCGVPIPADPVMIGMGSLAGDGHFSFFAALGVAWAAALTGDLIWFRIGRVWGRGALKLLCRISIEPDSCVARTHTRFARGGSRNLLLSKFIPGLSAVATPVAGMMGTPIVEFLLWDGLGALLWVSTWISVGFVFRRRLEAVGRLFETATHSFVILAVVLVVLYIGLKVYRRRRFLRSIRRVVIHPRDVRDQLERGVKLLIVDVRGEHEIEAEPVSLPGAVRRSTEELIERYTELPVDRDIVLYCSCPNDGASGKATLELRKLGYNNAKTLSGGLAAWQAHAFPLEAAALGAPAS